jgi:hypothetical protein
VVDGNMLTSTSMIVAERDCSMKATVCQMKQVSRALTSEYTIIYSQSQLRIEIILLRRYQLRIIEFTGLSRECQ